MRMRSEVFAQGCQQTNRQTNNDENITSSLSAEVKPTLKPFFFHAYADRQFTGPRLATLALLSSIVTKASRKLCRDSQISMYGLPSVAHSCGGQRKTRFDGGEIIEKKCKGRNHIMTLSPPFLLQSYDDADPVFQRYCFALWITTSCSVVHSAGDCLPNLAAGNFCLAEGFKICYAFSSRV